MTQPAAARAAGVPLIVIRELGDAQARARRDASAGPTVDVGGEAGLGYLAISSAPLNVEQDLPPGLEPSQPDPSSNEALTRSSQHHLHQIAERLLRGSGDPELVIAVHGFSNDLEAAESWYRSIGDWATANADLPLSNTVFLGYRWPSESLASQLPRRISDALRSLPTLPAGLWAGSGSLALVLLLSLLRREMGGWLSAGLLGVLLLSVTLAVVMATLVLLRLAVYFRDSFRASYFGTPDLVELIRQLDKAIDDLPGGNTQKREVKLSFLAHSLGNSVVTSALRILADAFAAGAIGDPYGSDPSKSPTPKIGNHFTLERLVMVAPDIPVESVLPRRANGLRSALRRVRESFVFSNEGDLALRLASTAANFFSFPSQSRFGGYRLGNLSIRHFRDRHDHTGQPPRYGIVPLAEGEDDAPVYRLEMRSSSREHRNLGEPPFGAWISANSNEITNIPSYFDCTDALDFAGTDALGLVRTDALGREGKPLVSLARRAAALNLIDYCQLLLAYIRFHPSMNTGVDTHGGYFRAESGKLLIYTLAFAGYATLLTNLEKKGSDLDRFCRDHQVQVALSSRDTARLNDFQYSQSAT